MTRNTYAILGHSFHTNKPRLAKIPNKVHLYMASNCGQVFSNNNKYQPILLNTKGTNRLLSKLSRFDPNNTYNNQEITIGPRNSLYYGVYKLPNNIKNPKGNSLVNTTSTRRIPLSQLLNIISQQTKNRSNVIGVFCRNIAHFGKNISYAEKRGKRPMLEIGGNEHNIRYTTLRSITEKRKKIKQAMNNIEKLMKNIPKGRKN